MANKTNFFVVSLIAMMAVAPAVADTPATQEWTKGRYDTAMQTINSRLATDVRDKIYNYDTNKNSPTYRQILDPLNTEAETAFSGINEVLQKVDGNDGTANSAVTLDTTAQNAFGAINELKGAIDNIDIPEQVQPDWNATTGKAAILNKPEIPAAQVQSDWNATEGMGAIKNKPTLAAVATSGSYNDLTDKPAAQDLTGYATETYVNTQIGELDIPAAQVQSDWNATEGMGVIKNKPTLATVATSGSYNDLDDKPAIPSIDGLATTAEMNTALASKQNSLTEEQLAAANSGIDATKVGQIATNKADIAAIHGAAQVMEDKIALKANQNYVETELGTLSNAVQSKQDKIDAEHPLAANLVDGLATVATSGSYNDLEDKPQIPAAQVQSDWTATEGMGVILHKPTLANVATSGAYSDLSGTPDLSGYATTSAMNTALEAKADDSDLTTLEGRVDDIEDTIGTGSMTVNGANQATIVAAINALDNKTNGMATDQNLTDLQNNVTALATTMGNTSLATTAQTVTGAVNELNTAVAGKQATIADLSDIRAGAALGATAVQDEDLAAVATSGDYDDLINKPTMPTVDNALNAQSSNAIANSAVASKLVSTAPGSGEYVLGYVNGTPTYIAVVGAE